MKVIEITAVFFNTAPSAVGPRYSLRHRRLFWLAFGPYIVINFWIWATVGR